MSAWKYRRIMPEVIVAKLRLIDPKDVASLAGRSLRDVYSMLENTSYRAEILDKPPEQLSSVSMENTFLKNFVRTFEEIMDHSPKDIGFLLSTILVKFEADNVRALLRAKVSELGVDEAMRYITPVGRLEEARCRKILESSKSVNDIIDLLSDTEYGSILKEALLEYEGTKVFLPFEVALDKYVYSGIWKATGKLRGLNKKIARTVLGIEIDSINVKVILRCKAMGISADQIKRYLVPVSEVFGEKEFEDAVRAPDIRSSIESLLAAARLGTVRDYQYLLTDLLEEYEASTSLSGLEIVLDRGLLKTCLRMLKRYTPFFNIGLILAFLNLKWFELRNLRAIVRGAEDRMPPDKIRRLLIFPD